MRAKAVFTAILLGAGVSMASPPEQAFESDTLATSAGDLTITFVGHGTLVFAFRGKVFHVDPYGKLADYAALPMNLPYTMTPEMVADAAKAFRPGILYPYHYGDTDPARLTALLAGEPGIEVRVRKMK